MPISFECPKCGKKLKAPDDAVGQSSRCPGCGTAVTCPEPILDAELIDPVTGEPGFAPNAPTPLVGLESSSSSSPAYGFDRPASAPSAPTEARRPCPMCGEMIVVGAARCRFCGEVFDESVAGLGSGRRVSQDERLTAGDLVLALLCGWVGCILGVAWMVQGKPKGWKMVLLSFISGIIGAAILSAVPRNP
jgi:predicted RNA-binding Zn-ribbon protein involved in translation (DUF1610 family)/uncharacterized membrane protein YeaQ/YmgE (transglycosylase-associated protein family)